MDIHTGAFFQSADVKKERRYCDVQRQEGELQTMDVDYVLQQLVECPIRRISAWNMLA